MISLQVVSGSLGSIMGSCSPYAVADEIAHVFSAACNL